MRSAQGFAHLVREELSELQAHLEEGYEEAVIGLRWEIVQLRAENNQLLVERSRLQTALDDRHDFRHPSTRSPRIEKLSKMPDSPITISLLDGEVEQFDHRSPASHKSPSTGVKVSEEPHLRETSSSYETGKFHPMRQMAASTPDSKVLGATWAAADSSPTYPSSVPSYGKGAMSSRASSRESLEFASESSGVGLASGETTKFGIANTANSAAVGRAVAASMPPLANVPEQQESHLSVPAAYSTEQSGGYSTERSGGPPPTRGAESRKSITKSHITSITSTSIFSWPASATKKMRESRFSRFSVHDKQRRDEALHYSLSRSHAKLAMVGEETASMNDRMKRTVGTIYFEMFFAAVIMTNSIFLGVQVNFIVSNPTASSPLIIYIVTYLYTFLFTIELHLRVWASGPRKFFCGKENLVWNYLDLIIVLASLIEIVSDIINLHQTEGETQMGCTTAFFSLTMKPLHSIRMHLH